MAGCLLALAFFWLARGAATAELRLVEAEGFSLRFDEGVWAPQKAAPPSLLTLRCIAPACARDGVVTFVRDERPLIAPGFTPFGPGAATGALVDVRLQSLTPASRLLARAPLEPIALGGTDGYRGLYDIEDRALARTAAIILLLRLGHGTLELRMAAPVLTETDITAFDSLIGGFELQK